MNNLASSQRVIAYTAYFESKVWTRKLSQLIITDKLKPRIPK